MQITRLCLSSLALQSRIIGTTVRTIGARASLATEEDKALHAIGFNIGTQLGDLRGFEPEGVESILSGIRAALLEEPPEVPLAEYVPKASELIRERASKKAEAAVAAGVAALEAAAAEDGATRTASGLVVLPLTEGDGASPSAVDTVEVHYEGTLVDGTIFDSSYKRGETISFPLSGVIKGWTEGLQLMKVGGKAKLTIPFELAYGERGSPPAIPPKSTLIFIVELLAIK